MSHLPNFITFFRIALVPVMGYFLTGTSREDALAAGITFQIACWSDFLDGYLARRWNISTDLGKLLDPLADKLIVATALVMLASLDRQPAVPAWMAAIVIGREIAVTGLRAVALGQGLVVASEDLGKYKTTYQMFAIQGLLLHYPFLGIDFFAGGIHFLWISIVIGLWSGVQIYMSVVRQLSGAASPPAPGVSP